MRFCNWLPKALQGALFLLTFVYGFGASAQALIECETPLLLREATESLVESQRNLSKRLDEAFSVESIERKFKMDPGHRDYSFVTDQHSEFAKRSLIDPADLAEVERLIGGQADLRDFDWRNHWEIIRPQVGVENSDREYGIVYYDPESVMFGPHNHADIFRDGATSEKNNWLNREVIIVAKDSSGLRTYRGQVKQMYYGSFDDDGLSFVSKFDLLPSPNSKPITVQIKGAEIKAIFRSKP